ncbi:MAG: hypothetical protein NZ693_05155, partial [Thermoflexales bacterium]|nr:hypothetical protein [Thermoflexales bacterium]
TQTLPGAGPEFAACNDGDRHTIRVDSGPIQSLVVIGDTGSTDIDTSGDGCRCDTKIISITFRPIQVEAPAR